jgi:hypothetical protein
VNARRETAPTLRSAPNRFDATLRHVTDHSRDPAATLVEEGVRRTLELARTWLAWDGRPRIAEDGERIYTPHKAIRRHADHLVDHLAQIEALLVGAPTEQDHWRASSVTLGSDLAAFTEPDLNEARERLIRLAQVYSIRLSSLPDEAWDAPRGADWTIRQIVEHVAPAWYAEQVGDLTAGPGGPVDDRLPGPSGETATD